jgi:hypothetical protein
MWGLVGRPAPRLGPGRANCGGCAGPRANPPPLRRCVARRAVGDGPDGVQQPPDIDSLAKLLSLKASELRASMTEDEVQRSMDGGDEDTAPAPVPERRPAEPLLGQKARPGVWG